MSTTAPPDPASLTAEQFAEARPGWTLVGYLEVALPYWRVRTRLRTLVRKRLGPIDEYLLRTVRAGVAKPEDISALLGLDRPVLEAAALGLLEKEALQLLNNELRLTPLGTDLVQESEEVVSEVRTYDIDWDGLLRRPIASLSSWLEPRDLRSLGLREIPPSPATRPDAEELRGGRDAIEALIRQAGHRRVPDFDILDVGGIDRRLRLFKSAIALAFQNDSARELQVAVVVDERTSEEHEAAIARAGIAKRLGITERGLRTSSAAIRSTLGRHFDAANPVPPYRHRGLLELALARAEVRLLIMGFTLRTAVLDKRVRGLIEERLEAGVQVHLAYGVKGRDGIDSDRYALEMLTELQDRFSTLGVIRLRRAHPAALVSDRSIGVVTGYDFLGHRGDPTAELRDQRGLVVSEPEAVDEIYEGLVEMLDSADRPARAGRRGNLQ